MDPRLWELYEDGDSEDEIAAILRLTRQDAIPPGVEIITQFGEIATCRLRRGDILDVRAAVEVTSMKAPTPLLAEDPLEEDEVYPGIPLEEFAERYTWNDERHPANESATGRGVAVAVIDWGLDFAHPDFRNEDGSTRLMALWDQRSQPGRTPPQPYGYGIVHPREAINHALQTPDPYKTLGYHPADVDGGRGAHGTHVMSIAAGNGRGGGPKGVAPEADLIFVHMGTWGQNKQVKLGNSVTLLEAIDFVWRTAGEKKCVVNMSMGRHGQQHDGTTPVEQGLDAAVRQTPNKAIVQSAGNYFGRRIHASGQLRPAESHHLMWQVSPMDITPNELEIWYPGRDIMTISIQSPDHSISQQIELASRTTLEVNGKSVGSLYHRANEPNTLDNHVHIFLYPNAPAGDWDITLIGKDIVDGRYHAWIERDLTCRGCQSQFADDIANPLHTTGTICNGLRTIAVGAFNPHSPERELGNFSSSGPTRDGRMKPDLCAPGVYILAARSMPRHADPHHPEQSLLTRMSGTSMASPHVAGTIALMYEVAPQPLRIEEVRNLLLASTEKIIGTHDSAPRIGSGYLDIERAVAAVRGFGRIEPKSIAQTPLTQGESQFEEILSLVLDDHAPSQHEVPTSLEANTGLENAVLVPTSSNDWASPIDTTNSTDTWPFEDYAVYDDFSEVTEMNIQNATSHDTYPSTTWETNRGGLKWVEMADEILQAEGAFLSAGGLLERVLSQAQPQPSASHKATLPAVIFDTFQFGGDPTLVESLHQTFEVIGVPGQTLNRPLQQGDLIVRRVFGEGKFGHVALLAETNLYTPAEAEASGIVVESQHAGLYGMVIEGGLRPHRRTDDFARRITSVNHQIPQDQMILRLRQPLLEGGAVPSEAGSADFMTSSEAVVRNSPEYIRWVQRSLNQLMGERLAVDGINGPLTQGAVRRFQRSRGLVVDGIVGPQTEAALIAAGAEPPPGYEAPSIPIPPIPVPPLPLPPVPTALRPGRWAGILASTELRTGNFVDFLIDGPDTFRVMVNAIRTAQSETHYIYLLGWWLTDNFDLLPPVTPTPTTRVTIQSLFTIASGRGVQIRAMLWDQFGTQNTAERDHIHALPTGAAILDDRTFSASSLANVGSHHQKVLIVKGSEGLIAFCGGIDFNPDRVPWGVRSGGSSSGGSSSSGGAGAPLHDVHCRMVGPSAHDLLTTFIQRWDHHPDHVAIDRTRGNLLGRSEPLPAPLTPQPTTPTGGNCAVRIIRTFNPVGTPPTPIVRRERSTLEVLRQGIQNSHRFIYMEDQYLVNPMAATLLNAALPNIDHLTILVPDSSISDMPRIWEARRDFIRTLTAGPHASKVRIFTPVTPPASRTPPVFGPHTYVHAKTWIFDDEMTVIGSANCNQRGWTHDSEVGAAIFDAPDATGLTFAQRLRMKLWAEHLNVPETRVTDGVASASLWLSPPTGAKIRPYNPTAGSDPFSHSLIPMSVIDPNGGP